MSRQFKVSLVWMACVLLLSACAQVNQPARTAAKRGPVCETASGHATSFGQANARLHAEASMRQQAGEIRGELLQSGLRRIRVSRSISDCQPLPNAFRSAGLAHCRSAAQVCGQ
jgi:hypothetical protein